MAEDSPRAKGRPAHNHSCIEGNPTASAPRQRGYLMLGTNYTISGELGFPIHISVIRSAKQRRLTLTSRNALWSPSALKICAKESGRIYNLLPIGRRFPESAPLSC